MLKFSVIIPTYNNVSTIKETLESVLNQVFENFEIIIVDGGSSDGTLEVVKEYSERDPRIRLIIFKKKSGPAAARNVGIRCASGEFVAFLDADDKWKRDLLLVAYKILNKDPQADMLIFEYLEEDMISGSKRWIHREHIPNIAVGRELLKHAFIEQFILTSGVIVRKQLLEECGGFSEDLILSEDWDLWLRILYKARKVYYINDVYRLIYRVTPSSLCSKKAKDLRNRLRALFSVIKRNKKILRESCANTVEFLKILIRSYVNAMVSAKLEYIKRNVMAEEKISRGRKFKLFLFFLTYDLWVGMMGGITVIPEILSTVEWNFRVSIAVFRSKAKNKVDKREHVVLGEDLR